MLTHNELKAIIESLPQQIDKNDRANVEKIRQVATQIGFTTPSHDCKCQDKWNDLAIKLRLWLKQHPEPCSWVMRPGIVRKTPFGNAYTLSLTNEMCEWLLVNDTESSKWLTKIVSDEPNETSNTINQNETESVSENVSAETAEPEPEPVVRIRRCLTSTVVVEEPKKKSTRRKK